MIFGLADWSTQVMQKSRERNELIHTVLIIRLDPTVKQLELLLDVFQCFRGVMDNL